VLLQTSNRFKPDIEREPVFQKISFLSIQKYVCNHLVNYTMGGRESIELHLVVSSAHANWIAYQLISVLKLWG